MRAVDFLGEAGSLCLRSILGIRNLGLPHAYDPSRERPNAQPRCKFGAEGATAPETLRQTDRAEEATLESGAFFLARRDAPTG